MSELMESFQRQHQHTLEQLDRGEVDDDFLDQVHELIGNLREAGATTADPSERAQLRAWVRFWGGIVYDYTGVYPTGALLPPNATTARPSEPSERHRAPALLWLLVGSASVVIVMAGLLAVVWSGLYSRITGGATPPSTPPIVSYAAVGTGLVGEGDLQAATDTFCLDTPEIVATFALEQLQPNTELRWELLRGDEVMAAQPAAPWGQETRYVTVRIQAGGSDGVDPGRYDLLLYAGQQVIAMQSFEILADAPRIFGLQTSDVPSPIASPADPPEFGPGLRVVYLTYDYQGLCQGLELTHALYREGETIQESTEVWDGNALGRRQVVFQGAGNPGLEPGNYELAVALGGAEQGRIAFTVAEPIVEATPEPEKPVVPPAFGHVVIAMGVLPNGTPVLPAEDVPLDVNTKAVYAIFDYEGMDSALPWSAVWMRNGQEVARQETFWNVDLSASEGTQWVTYYDATGKTLSTGVYSVTLYIDDEQQATADFGIGVPTP